MENLQVTLRPQGAGPLTAAWVTEGMYAFCYRVMFEAGYLTLFGRDLARQDVQRGLIRSSLDHFKEFDRVFPALVAGLPIRAFKTAHRAREKLAEGLGHERLRARARVSELISLRMHLNDTLSTFDDAEKARTHLALLWASQANTIPATFWSLFQMIRCARAVGVPFSGWGAQLGAELQGEAAGSPCHGWEPNTSARSLENKAALHREAGPGRGCSRSRGGWTGQRRPAGHEALLSTHTVPHKPNLSP